MKDRIPLYPGRVTLTPVSGQANTYDMTRADQPTEEGTPLNKNTLLKDATAALYGLGSDAVPDEVLLKIALTGLDTSSYYWIKNNFKQGVTLGEVKRANIQWTHDGYSYYKFYYADNIIKNDGTISLENPKLFDQSTDDSSLTSLRACTKSKYIQAYSGNVSSGSPSGDIYFGTNEDDATFQNWNGSSTGIYKNAQLVSMGFDNSFVEMLKSNDPNAYPNGIVKPFEYIKYGNLLPMKLATGTYIGTGTYGVNDPTVLTFPFVPKLLLIQNVSVYNTTKYNGYYIANTPGERVASLTLLYDMARDSLHYTFHSSARRSIITQSSNLDCNFSVSEDGKTFKFWGVGSTNASIQLNNNGNKYYWLIMA